MIKKFAKKILYRVILSLILAAATLSATAAPALAGSLIRGQELTIPSDGSGVLEKVCQSTTEFGDAVTHAGVSGLQTFSTEDCT